MRILVTGMSGLIGTATRRALATDHELTALNRSTIDGVPAHRSDIVDFDAIRGAFEGQDLVVHLAAHPGEHFTWEQLRDTNVEGTRHVFRAAADAGVGRVVFASSGATVAGSRADYASKSAPIAVTPEGTAHCRCTLGDQSHAHDKCHHKLIRLDGMFVLRFGLCQDRNF